jgi:hypothetical protein
MPLTITHAFVSSKTDGPDTTQVRPSDWNNSHIISGNVDETMFSFTDITTANVSTSKHGLTPKLPGVSTEFLNGAGAWTTPSGGSSFDLTANHTFTGLDVFEGANDAEYTAIFPLAVNGSIQGLYGFNSMEVTSVASETGIQMSNTSEGGRTYSLLVTGGTSEIGNGLFVIADATGGGPRFQIDSNGATSIPGILHLGTFPDCDNAQLTVYATMTSDTYSSMIDIAATSNGADQAVALNVIIYGEGTINDNVNSIYTRTDISSGTTAEAVAIWIDVPQVTGSLGVAYGLYVANLASSGVASTANVYSAGRTSQNFFEGVFTQSPYNQLQSGTITDGGSSSSGNTINGSGTQFTSVVFVGDIVSDGNGHLGQVTSVVSDTELVVWPPNSFTSVSGAPINIYPATFRLLDQLSTWGITFGVSQSACVISGFSEQNTSPCNFVIGAPTNMVTGMTTAAAIIGGEFNTVSAPDSVIVGGINNVITGNQSVVLAGDAMTVSGNEVVAMGLGSIARTVSQNNCFVVMDGNVGFGTVSPSHQLEVAGSLRATTFAGVLNTTSSGPSPVIDCSLGTIQILDLGQNMSPTFTNLVTGQRITLYVLQGGNFKITWPGNVSGNPEINLTNGATTIIDFISPDGTNLEPIQYNAKALPGNPNSLSVAASGGEIWYDADGIWIGQTDTTWKQILYAA